MKKRLRIIHVFNGSYVSGPEMSVIPGLSFLLQEKKIDCTALFLEETRLEGNQKSICRSYASKLNLPTCFVDVNSRLDLSAILRLRRLIKRENYSHVHAQDVKASVYVWLATLGLGVQKISTFHGFMRISLIERFYQWIYFLLLFFFDNIVTISGENFSRIKNSYPWPFSKIDVIKNAINPPIQKSDADILNHLSRISPLPPKPWGVMLARFSVEKNHITLLKALTKIDKDMPFTVWLFGFGDLENSLKEKARELGVIDRVIFGGQLPEGSSYLSAFDIFLLISTTEGLPMSLLEAASLGMTIVGSDIPGILEVIPDKEYAFLGPALDENILASNIKRSLKMSPDDKFKMSVKLKRRIKDNFSLEIWANKHMEIYSK